MEGIASVEMNTELVCVMASLGYCDGEEYYKGVDCLESLKDMIRFLRHEDLQTCDIRRQMGHSKVLQNDLIPLLVSNPDDKALSDIVLRLLVNLTSAPHLCFEQNPVEEVTDNSPERKSHELQLMSYLQAYKEAFAEKSAMSAVSSHLGRILQQEVNDRDEDDNLLLERILLLIRNLLYIPADPDDEKRTDDDVTIHDQILWSMHENGVDDLLIYISSSEDEENWCMHACEIISHIFREQNPEELAVASEFRSYREKQEDSKTLQNILEKEKAQKTKMLDLRGARHSNFGGSFWVKDRQALKKDETLVYHRTLQSTKDMSYDFDKMPEKKRRTKKPLLETNKERKSTLSIRLFLKEFCIKFLEHGYNNLMTAVKRSLDARRTQKHDESFYLAIMRFFMTFNRVYAFRVDYVSSTFAVQIFNFVQSLMIEYHDSYDVIKPTKGRERKIQFTRRIHLALNAYKELLTYVAVMAKGKDENLVTVANVIQSNIFYIEEYRNVFLLLLKNWNATFQTRVYLKDLVEACHLYLKLFETFLKEKGTFLTRTKKVKRKVRRPKKTSTQSRRCPIEITPEQADNLWQDEVSVELSACIQGRSLVPDDVRSPFDPLSDVPLDDQKTQAFAIIQRLLRLKETGMAVAFLRASRECWPEEVKFGTANMSGEEEFMCLREMYFMDLNSDVLQQADDRIREEEMEETQEEIVEEEVEEQERVVTQGEKVFEIKSFLKMLARPQIAEPYCYLLKFFDENKQHTNHCIIKMLHRIAVDLEMYPMLFQLSLFITFKKILNEPKTSMNKEMRGFAKYILGKFFDLYKKNPMVVVELLFWKTNTECYEMVEGYGSLNVKRAGKKTSGAGKWTFEEEQELIDLFEQFKDGDDVIEKIAERPADRDRSVQQIRNKLVRLRLLDKPRKRRANEWTEEETESLGRIYEEFKETDDPLGDIMRSLTSNKSKKSVVGRLLEIGLVQDKRELHKKRKKKNRQEDNGDEEDDENLVVDEEREEASYDENEGIPRQWRDMVTREFSDDDGDESNNDNNGDDDDDDDIDDLPSNSTMLQILEKLCGLGFENEIDWVRIRLNRLVNERETSDEDDWQSVPLVPITEDHENALSSKLFKRMLKKVGISPPANEQESFWRISRSLSPAELREFVAELSNKGNNQSRQKRSNFAAVSSQNGTNQPNVPSSAQNNQTNGEINGDQEESDDDIFERFLDGNRQQNTGTLESSPSNNDEQINTGAQSDTNEQGNQSDDRDAERSSGEIEDGEGLLREMQDGEIGHMPLDADRNSRKEVISEEQPYPEENDEGDIHDLEQREHNNDDDGDETQFIPPNNDFVSQTVHQVNGIHSESKTSLKRGRRFASLENNADDGDNDADSNDIENGENLLGRKEKRRRTMKETEDDDLEYNDNNEHGTVNKELEIINNGRNSEDNVDKSRDTDESFALELSVDEGL